VNDHLAFFDSTFLTTIRKRAKSACLRMATCVITIIVDVVAVVLFYTEKTAWYFLVTTLSVFLLCGWVAIHQCLTRVLPSRVLHRLSERVAKAQPRLEHGTIESIAMAIVTFRGIACHAVTIATAGSSLVCYLVFPLTIPSKFQVSPIRFDVWDQWLVALAEVDDRA